MSTPDTDMRKTIDPIMRHFPIWIALAALGMACWGPVERVYASYINKPGGGSGSNYQTIEDEGVALTQRPTFNFIGGTIAATDDAGNNRTNVTVSGAGSGNVTTSATLTAGLPVIGNGTVDVDIGTRSGNTTEYMNGDGGGYGSGNCAEFDANGNITDSGAACGGSGSLSGWVLVDTDTPAAAADLRLTGFDSTAARWKIDVYGVTLSATEQIDLQVSTDGGSTWEATNYETYTLRYSPASTAVVSPTTDIDVTGNGSVGSGGNQSYNLSMLAWGPGSTTLAKFFNGTASYRSAGTTQLVFASGAWNSTTAVNAVRFLPTNSATITGTGRLYKWSD